MWNPAGSWAWRRCPVSTAAWSRWGRWLAIQTDVHRSLKSDTQTYLQDVTIIWSPTVLMPPSEISLTLISSAAESLQEEKLRQRSRRWPQKFPHLRSKEHPDLNSEKERRFGHSKQRDIPPATAAPPVFHDSNAAAVPTGSGGPTSVPRLQCGSPVTGAGPVPRPVPRKGPIKTFWPAGGGLREILQPGNYHNMDS